MSSDGNVHTTNKQVFGRLKILFFFQKMYCPYIPINKNNIFKENRCYKNAEIIIHIMDKIICIYYTGVKVSIIFLKAS